VFVLDVTMPEPSQTTGTLPSLVEWLESAREPLMSWCACLLFCNFQTNGAKAIEFRVIFIYGKMKFKFEK
jgi:hypothetical protein